jgi:hypothetical protein
MPVQRSLEQADGKLRDSSANSVRTTSILCIIRKMLGLATAEADLT